MLVNTRVMTGVYEDDKMAKIKAKGSSSIFMRLADEKATAAKAWLVDILMQPDEEPFGVDPSPVPDLPPEQKQIIQQQVMMQAQQDLAMGIHPSMADVRQRIELIESEIQGEMKHAARKVEMAVENKIKDVVVESNWNEALEEVISDLVDYKAGFLKGPIYRKKTEVEWGPDGMPQISSKLKLEYEAVSPFNIYPAPTSRDINDGYFLEKHSLSRKTLVNMKGAQGYDSAAIDAVLEAYGNGGLKKWILRNQGAGTAAII